MLRVTGRDPRTLEDAASLRAREEEGAEAREVDRRTRETIVPPNADRIAFDELEKPLKNGLF